MFPAPAAIALQAGHQLRRAFLVASLQIVGEPDPISCPSHERRLDRVVTQNPAANRPYLGQLRERAMFHEQFEPDDSVVPPIVASA